MADFLLADLGLERALVAALLLRDGYRGVEPELEFLLFSFRRPRLSDGGALKLSTMALVRF